MYRGLFQEAKDNFASEGLCSFVVEKHCRNSFAPVVVLCADCPFAPVENLAGVGTVGAEIVEAVAVEVLAAGIGVVGTIGLSTPFGSVGLIVGPCSL